MSCRALMQFSSAQTFKSTKSPSPLSYLQYWFSCPAIPVSRFNKRDSSDTHATRFSCGQIQPCLARISYLRCSTPGGAPYCPGELNHNRPNCLFSPTYQVIEKLQPGRNGKAPVKVFQGQISLISRPQSYTTKTNDRLLGYGLTETSPTTHVIPADWSVTKAGSIGVLLPNLEARLVVDGEGDGLIDAEEGQPGELWVRGPNVMKVSILRVPPAHRLSNIISKGYLNNVEATNDCITQDRWFKTGDIATRDADGFYWIVDRRKELIKYKVRPSAWFNLYV